MPRDQFSIFLSFPVNLKPVAIALSYLYGERHGRRGSITQLFQQVMLLKYLLVPSPIVLDEAQLEQARDVLVKFQERSQSQQPFLLHYQDSQGETRQFTVRYGEVVVHKRRYYLDAWVDEPGEGLLPHNRCFRLDRIQQIGAVVAGEWREGLDTIVVEMELFGRLQNACEKRPGDVMSFKGDRVFVTRHVSSTFWLIREVLSYGGDCHVIEPFGVWEEVGEAVRKIAETYGCELERVSLAHKVQALYTQGKEGLTGIALIDAMSDEELAAAIELGDQKIGFGAFIDPELFQYVRRNRSKVLAKTETRKS